MPLPERSAAVLSRLLLPLALLLPAGCQAAGGPGPLPPPPPPLAVAAPLHPPVSPAPAVASADPVLHVALAARLGPAESAESAAAAPLRLRAASGMVRLIDAEGRRFMAPELVLHWQRVPLPKPLLWRRQVAGPFASFESAERAAELWRAGGAEGLLIAHPRDWEVWAPENAPAVAEVPARAVTGRQTSALELQLRRPDGAVTLRGPLRIEAERGLAWGAGVYAGPFRLLADAHGGWTLVEQVPLERYLAGVVPQEIGAGSPAAALAAQAVLARTWALRNSHRFAVDGYHLCADTQCQVYSDPRQAGSTVLAAISTTRHRVLTWENRPIHAVYHASNGGVAAGFPEAWNGAALPYLKASPDGPAAFANRFPVPLTPSSLPALLVGGKEAYGSDHPRFRWQRRLTADGIAQALGSAGGVGTIQAVEVRERGPSGRVLTLAIRGSAGERQLRLDAIRRTLRTLPSTLFTLVPEGQGVWLVQGGGFGHGAGLSQAGAIDLARRGWSSERILGHYYPGTRLQTVGELGDAP
ncbi:SpoIID/LytB domain-containing protein [Cyanobium sp. FGCU-6]|nr:SpoIID/LytB domain-containing protein [Cyanobium sp. FGCU6]